MNSEMWQRIRYARARANLTQQALADALGISKSAVAQWEARDPEKRTRPERDNIAPLARELKVSLAWLMSDDVQLPPVGTLETAEDGTDSASFTGTAASPHDARPILVWETEDELPPGDYVLVPRLSIRLSAGNGRAAVEIDKKMPQAFRADWIRARRLKPRCLTCMSAAGDSMSPWLNDGDAVVVDRGDRDVRDGQPYAVRYGDELRVKRLFRRFDGGLLLRSDNADRYPDETITPDELEHVEVIGRVVWRGG